MDDLCAVCGSKLSKESDTPELVLGAMMKYASRKDRQFLQEKLVNRREYKCRNCSTSVCMKCAKVSRCPKCSGQVFDVAY